MEIRREKHRSYENWWGEKQTWGKLGLVNGHRMMMMKEVILSGIGECRPREKNRGYNVTRRKKKEKNHQQQRRNHQMNRDEMKCKKNTQPVSF